MKKQLLIFVLIAVSLSALVACANKSNITKNTTVVSRDSTVISTETKEAAGTAVTKKNGSTKVAKEKSITASSNNVNDSTEVNGKTTAPVQNATSYASSTSSTTESSIPTTTQSVTDKDGWINKWY